jgi:hypothetical protein
MMPEPISNDGDETILQVEPDDIPEVIEEDWDD